MFVHSEKCRYVPQEVGLRPGVPAGLQEPVGAHFSGEELVDLVLGQAGGSAALAAEPFVAVILRIYAVSVALEEISQCFLVHVVQAPVYVASSARRDPILRYRI